MSPRTGILRIEAAISGIHSRCLGSTLNWNLIMPWIERGSDWGVIFDFVCRADSKSTQYSRTTGEKERRKCGRRYYKVTKVAMAKDPNSP